MKTAKQGKSNPQEPLESALAHKFRWALETTLLSYGYRPDRNKVEDWADDQSADISGDPRAFTRGGSSTPVSSGIPTPSSSVGSAGQSLSSVPSA